MSKSARDIMTPDAECVQETDSILDAVGIVSQADIARNLDDEKTGDLVEAISAG